MKARELPTAPPTTTDGQAGVDCPFGALVRVLVTVRKILSLPYVDNWNVEGTDVSSCGGMKAAKGALVIEATNAWDTLINRTKHRGW